jgi:preprotein translocase subunit YajC
MTTSRKTFLTLLSSFIALPAFADAPQSVAASFGSFLPLLLIIVVFYFMLIRPQMKRNKEQKNLMENLSKGDEVVTVGGMLGKITKVGDNFVTLSISDTVEVKVQKHAVANVVPKGSLKTE